jgi:hypothetical protein
MYRDKNQPDRSKPGPNVGLNRAAPVSGSVEPSRESAKIYTHKKRDNFHFRTSILVNLGFLKIYEKYI